jgi:GT2 family glycosyltransferase
LADAKPVLTIIVVLYNSAGHIGQCLRSLLPELETDWAQLILVDNNSPDEGLDVALHEAPSAEVVRLPENRGFAAGVNAGLRVARGRYFLLLNPDVTARRGGLKTLVDWMESHPTVGACSPEIVAPDGKSESPGRAVPSTWRVMVEASRLHLLLPKDLRARILQGPYWIGGDLVDAGWIPGTAMLVRREVTIEVGGLCEDMFMYGEDIEWCCRIRRHGWRVAVCADTSFAHARSTSFVATWGDAERERRIASGVDDAHRRLYGPTRARLLAGAIGLSSILEAAGPSRDNAERRRALRASRMWMALALSRRVHNGR